MAVSKKKKSRVSSARTKTAIKSRKTKVSKTAPTRKSQTPTPISGAIWLLWDAFGDVKKRWRLFGGILVIYVVLNIILVHGLSAGLQLQTFRDNLHGVFKGDFAQLSGGLTLFGVLLTSYGTTTSAVANLYQSLLIVLVSLAFIWALRRSYDPKSGKIRIRDTYYKGTAPFVPFLLVLFIMGLQLIPLVVGSNLYGLVIGNGIAASALEKVVWAGVFFGLAVLSLYFLCTSIMALYIVTLPDMTPMVAIRSARQLVRHRRSIIIRKLLFLPLALAIVAAIITVPLIWAAPRLADWVFYFYSLLGLAIVHSYLYKLYRELI